MNLLAKFKLTDLRLTDPTSLELSDYRKVLIHLISFILLSATVFQINSPALFLRWDGLFHLVHELNQHDWAGSLLSLNLDFLKANGELSFPNFYRLNPGFVIARWFGNDYPPLWIVSTVLALTFFLSSMFLVLSVGFRLEIALGCAWLCCLLTLPYVVPTLTYIRLWGNQPLLPGISSLFVALGLIFRIGRRSLTDTSVNTCLTFSFLAYTCISLPIVFVIGLPFVGFFSLAALTIADNNRERWHKIIAYCLIFATMIPFLTFAWELHAFSKVSFFQADLESLPLTIRDASFFIHQHEEGGLLSELTFGAALITALTIAISASGPVRLLSISYLLYIGSLLLTTSLVAAMGATWWGPPPAYLDMMALPFHTAYLTIIGMVIFRSMTRTLLRLSPQQWGPIFLPTSKVSLSLAIVLIPWILCGISFTRAGTPEFFNHGPWPWPLAKTPLIATLEEEVGLYDGAPFRGRVANLAGAPGPYPPERAPFHNQYNYDLKLLSSAGNDHRNLGLWSYNIPTLTTSNQFTSPFFHLIITRFLNKPHSRSLRAHEAVTVFNRKILETWGTRYVVHDTKLSHGAMLKERFSMAERELFLYELPSPNLGTYSPTNIFVAKNIMESLSLMTRQDIDFRQQAIIFAPLESHLIKAEESNLEVFQDSLRITGRSKGKSLIIVPMEYTNCLIMENNLSTSEQPIFFRANISQTGILFNHSMDITFRLRFGVFANQGCRLKDLQAAKDLGLAEVANWWPSDQP